MSGGECVAIGVVIRCEQKKESSVLTDHGAIVQINEVLPARAELVEADTAF